MFGNNAGSFFVTIALALLSSFVLPAAPSSSASLGSGDALLRTLSSRASAPLAGLTVALGTNVCVDLVSSASAVLGEAVSALGSLPPVDAASLSSESIAAGVLAFHALSGAAAERAADPLLLATLVARADAAGGARRSLGGNAALMARALLKTSSTRVILGGPVGPFAVASLPGVTFATPLAENDATHLILEYAAGESIAQGQPLTPRANRFIITADALNSAGIAAAIGDTFAAASVAGAHAVVISGLHMLEPLGAGARRGALADVAIALAAAAGSPNAPPVHVEMASVADVHFAGELARAVLPFASSFGCNEQELATLYEALGGRYSVGGGGGGGRHTRRSICTSRPRSPRRRRRQRATSRL